MGGTMCCLCLLHVSLASFNSNCFHHNKTHFRPHFRVRVNPIPQGFFRKSPFCTFSCINPGFGGTWDKLWIFFHVAIFLMLQKNAFGQKKIWISCTGSKVPFWQNWKIAKMALLNLCMKFKIFFDQKHSFEALWKWE